MAVTAWRFPATVTTEDGGEGIALTSPNNIKSSDDIYARASSLATGGNSDILKAVGFFSSADIPAQSTIRGIEFRVEYYADGELGYPQNPGLIKNNSPTGAQKNTAAPSSNTETTFTWGGATDLWGATISPSDAISATFGAMFSCYAYVSRIFVDSAQMRVYYDPPPVANLSGAVTEGADTSTSTAKVLAQAVASVTEGADVMQGVGIARASAVSNVTEGADTSTATATALVKAAGDVTEGPDTSSAQIITNIRYARSDVTEGDDVASSTATVLLRASGAVTEGADVMQGITTSRVSGVGAATEGDDVSSGSARVILSLVSSNVEDADTSSASARAVVQGQGSVTEGADTSTGTLAIAILSDTSRTVTLADQARRTVTLAA